MDRNVARAKYRVAFESIAGRYTGPLPAIVEAVEALPVTSVTLEGEGVICGPDGKSDFDRMRARFSRNGAPEAFLYAFDLLDLDGQDLRGKRWDHRRALLAQLLTGADEGIRLCEHIEDTDGAVFPCRLQHGAGGHRREAPR